MVGLGETEVSFKGGTSKKFLKQNVVGERGWNKGSNESQVQMLASLLTGCATRGRSASLPGSDVSSGHE